MSLLSIVTSPAPILKNICIAVDLKNDNIAELISDMIETAEKNNLVGLAANQVESLSRIFIIDINSSEDKSIADTLPFNFKVFINPLIVYTSKEKIYNWEMCASLPGLIGLVGRYADLHISYYNMDGERIQEDYNDWLARIIQHENSHLNGELFTKTARETRRINEKLVD